MQTLIRETVESDVGARETVRVLRPLTPDRPSLHPTTTKAPAMRVGVRGPARCESSSPATLHGSGLTARGRVLFALAWMILLALAVLVVARPFSDGESGPNAPTVTVEVQPGDTLWDYARAADPQGDPREVIHSIVDLNGLDSAGDIRPGDTLLVPDFR